LGFSNVITYIISGNIVLQSRKPANEVKAQIETALPKVFKLDTEIIKVLVLGHNQLKAIVDNRPDDFGDQPDTYHNDTIFLMGIDVDEAIKVFNPREGVDKIWPGDGVIYSRRLSAERTKSRLSTMMSSPLYKSMTIRNWNTTTKLLDISKIQNNRKET
jgi:uncharacterized protein (DUF1697 family)